MIHCYFDDDRKVIILQTIFLKQKENRIIKIALNCIVRLVTNAHPRFFQEHGIISNAFIHPKTVVKSTVKCNV